MSERPAELAPSAPPDASSPGAESGATATFLAELRGGGGDGGPGAGGERKSKLSGPTLLVLGVVAAGIAILFGMRKFATGGAGDFSPVKIEYTPDAAAAARAKSQRAVLDALERSGTPVQVPSDQIKKNPFELAARPKGTTEPVKPTGVSDEQKAAERQKKVLEALGTLRLNGIMDGRTPLARINGETVRAGDALADTPFTVKSITGRTVVLECEGKEYQLGMEAAKTPGAVPRRGK